jgi:hypothetical protein
MLSLLRIQAVRRWLRYNAIRRGLLAQDRKWLVVLAIGLLGRQANKVLKRGEMPVRFREKLEPGTSLVITHLAPDPRRQRGRGR